MKHATSEPPWNHLDPGIIQEVRFIWNNGFRPTDSGDGVSKVANVGSEHCLSFPHVFCEVNPGQMVSEAQRAWLLPWALNCLVKPTVEVSYNPEDDKAVLMFMWEAGE